MAGLAGDPLLPVVSFFCFLGTSQWPWWLFILVFGDTSWNYFFVRLDERRFYRGFPFGVVWAFGFGL